MGAGWRQRFPGKRTGFRLWISGLHHDQVSTASVMLLMGVIRPFPQIDQRRRAASLANLCRGIADPPPSDRQLGNTASVFPAMGRPINPVACFP